MPFFDEDQRKQLKLFARYGGIGIQIAISLALGWFGGQWLDEKLGTAPWLGWVGFGLGLAAGSKGLYDLVKKTDLEKIDD